ncbi:hypothetical protein KY342_03860 [Candidatus Woesearchaeota archaeon]|nr:hypothetical protein [Candidatus Woesearchaeota archaeon]
MSHKYAKQSIDVKKFFYSPGSFYCAIIGKDREDITHIREAILDHYTGNCHDYKQKQFIEPGKGIGLAGQLIHLTTDIADKIKGDAQYKGIKIELSPINFEEPKQRKSALQRLINQNS